MPAKSARGPDQRSAAHPPLSGAEGLALVATLLMLALIGLIVTAAMRGALSSARTSGLEYHEARSFYAAEAGGEAALAQLKLALQDGYLDDDELADISAPTLPGFSYDRFEIERVGEPVVETITDGPFTGLYALTQNVDIVSVAEDAAGTAGGVVLSAKAQAIPIFQFGVFFEEDLEATNGPPMDFQGRVHANGDIYLSSGDRDGNRPNAWYREVVTTPNDVYHDRKDEHSVRRGVYINDSEGNEIEFDFDSRSTPDAEAFKAASCANFDCRLQTGAFDVDSLRLPLPEGVSAYELIRPREDSDSEAERSVKFAWNADTYVTVDFTNMRNYSAACGDGPPPLSTPPDLPTVTMIRGGRPVPDAEQVCTMFSFVWSAFYDGREDELKDVVRIDIGEITDWVRGGGDRAMQVIYVAFVFPTGGGGYSLQTRRAMLDGEIDPAIHFVKGAELPNPMTVVSGWPLYVQGDYNSFDKKPAALAGDGITILSEAWEEDQNRPNDAVFESCGGDDTGDINDGGVCRDYLSWAAGWRNGEAGETTVNAAIVAGHWPTPCDHEEPGCSGGYENFYGGGIENFPRFLESWREGGGRVVFHYRGSLVSPFTSQKTVGTWNGTYYDPPQRDWSFDTDFRNPALLPPGTPNVGNVIRTAMREVF